VRTVRLKKQKVRVAAPRELVYGVVAAAGKTVSDTGKEKVVEFETRWRGRVTKTIEAVEFDPLERITYRWMEGPLHGVEEEIRFEDSAPRRRSSSIRDVCNCRGATLSKGSAYSCSCALCSTSWSPSTSRRRGVSPRDELDIPGSTQDPPRAQWRPGLMANEST
jgi:hypothetical protein